MVFGAVVPKVDAVGAGRIFTRSVAHLVLKPRLLSVPHLCRCMVVAEQPLGRQMRNNLEATTSRQVRTQRCGKQRGNMPIRTSW